MVVTHVNMNTLRARWGDLIAGVRERSHVVVLTFHGRPAVALVSYREYERYRDWLEAEPRPPDNPP